MIRFARLVNDRVGESHFEDAIVEVASILDDARRQGQRASEELRATSATVVATVPQTDRLSWQCPARPQLLVWLDGETDVEASDGERRRFRPGDVLSAEDTTGRGHRTIHRQAGLMLVVDLVSAPENEGGG